mgnify:CR=1 FL=1
MKKNKIVIFLLIMVFNQLIMRGCTQNYEPQDSCKKPEFAGQFYPAEKDKLTNAMEMFFGTAQPAGKNKPVAIIVPHAGIIYSGQIAADAYNQAKPFDYDIIILLGTNHTTAGFRTASFYSEKYYDTPLGRIKIDTTLPLEIKKNFAGLTTNKAVNAKEHSIEVQLPFIQYAFPTVSVVPIVVGQMNADDYYKLGHAIANAVRDKNVLIVASSDLSHYTDFSHALTTDKGTLTSITQMSPEKFLLHNDETLGKGIPALVTCACGEAPIATAMVAAKELGAKEAKIISYANSGHTTVGDIQKVVGYGAVTFYKEEGNTDENSAQKYFVDPDDIQNDKDKISDSDKKYLLRFARSTVEEYLKAGALPLAEHLSPNINLKRGAFVTLRKSQELRGCVGRMLGDMPLYKVIGTMAIEAAFNDNRFTPVKQEELQNIEFEISVLTPVKKIKNADAIVLGRDGVIVRKNNLQAVYLPQVATETGWGKEEFLDQLCLKAGLKPGDWKDAELFVFQAEVFSESDFK